MEFFAIFMLLCLAPSVLSTNISQTACNTNVFNILNFGGVGDGHTDDSQAFLRAWESLCEAQGSIAKLEIPQGKTFLLSSVTFEGPCKSTQVVVSILGDIVAPQMSSWHSKDSWIKFSHVDGLSISGQGQIDGRGATWWNCRRCERPTSLVLNGCNGFKLSGVTSINSPRTHISIDNCQGAAIYNIRLTSPKDSPNTDGIDIGQSSFIQIHDSVIGTGDDCVAINGGSSFISITNVSCGPGHGISVGSLGEIGQNAMVEEVHVRYCNFTGTTNGVRIKTMVGGECGYARKITFEQITFQQVTNPIIIDQHYCPHGNCLHDQSSNVHVRDITYSGIHGTSADEDAIIFNCSRSVPCSNIVMNDVNIECVKPRTRTTSTCMNAHGTTRSTKPDVPCLVASF